MPAEELFRNIDAEHCLKRLNKERKQTESNMKNAALSKKAGLLHTFTTKSNIFDTNLPQEACESSQKLTDRLQWNAASRLYYFDNISGKVNKVAPFLSVFIFELHCCDYLPKNPKLCWDMKCSGSSYPFSSACIICNTSKNSLKVLEKIKTRGWHAWAGEGWKCGSTGERTFPPADEVWYKDMTDWFISIISHSCCTAITTWWERGKRQKNFE